MHTVAIFSKAFYKGYMISVSGIVKKLSSFNTGIYIFRPLYDYLINNGHPDFNVKGFFTCHEDLPADTDFLISLGGDGTLLTAVSIVKDSGIPVAGINSGRLGFLSGISENSFEELLEKLHDGTAEIEERSLIQWCDPGQDICKGGNNIALNEITIQKSGTPLLTTHVYYNDEFLNSYFSDGLIIATPTGSTAYSLSTGGPILTPDTHNFIISPICAHNLNVRPLVIPDNAILKLQPESRTKKFIITLDSLSVTCDTSRSVTVSKAPFNLRLIKPVHGYFANLRQKLMWGADTRNL